MIAILLVQKTKDKEKPKECKNIYKQKRKESIKELMRQLTLKFPSEAQFFRDVMGNYPNVANLQKFFANELIQGLWFDEFQKSEALKDILKKMSN
jgi:hypothetical protein